MHYPVNNVSSGGFAVGLHLPPGTELQGAVEAALDQIDQIITAMREALQSPGPAV